MRLAPAPDTDDVTVSDLERRQSRPLTAEIKNNRTAY